MNRIEGLFIEQMEDNKFHTVVNDDFSFVDSLTDQVDLEKLKEEE